MAIKRRVRSPGSKLRAKLRQDKMREVTRLNRPPQNDWVIGMLKDKRTHKTLGKIALDFTTGIHWWNARLEKPLGFRHSYYYDDGWTKIGDNTQLGILLESLPGVHFVPRST